MVVLASSSKLKREVIRLLKEDEEFRYAIAGLVGLDEILKRTAEHDRKFNEILERLAEHDKKFEEIFERFAEHDRKFNEILERLAEHDKKFEEIFERFAEHDRRFEELSMEIIKLREDMNRGFAIMERHITAIGARWGIISEQAFREGIKGLLEKELGFKVEKWREYDGEGIVYSYPSDVEVDVVVHDEKVILVEVTSHARRSDISLLRAKANFYEKKTGKTPARVMLVTPYADEEAVNAAKELNIELYTKV
jgi:hypothetical protein